MFRTIYRRMRGIESKRIRLILPAALLPLVLVGCGHVGMMLGAGPTPPPESEFGFGPRASAQGLYEATIEPAEPLRVRRMQQVTLTVRDAENAVVADAKVIVDGGMPQHNHGLPTTPRVTRAGGDGSYLVDGVRFNMGGWWELKFGIESAVGADTVTFNLRI